MAGQVGDGNHMLAATNPLHGTAQHHSNPLVDLATHAKATKVPLLYQAECAHVRRVCTCTRSRAASFGACTCRSTLSTWHHPIDFQQLEVLRLRLRLAKRTACGFHKELTECKSACVGTPCSLKS